MLVRVFNAAPIVFKGSGFYVTDSRKSAPPDGSTKAGDSPPKTEPPAKNEGATKSESAGPAPAGESKKASDSAA